MELREDQSQKRWMGRFLSHFQRHSVPKEWQTSRHPGARLAVTSFDITDWVMGWQSIIPLSLSLLGKSENPESCSAHSSKSDVIAYSLQHSCTE